MTIDIRRVAGEELAAWYEAMRLVFLRDRPFTGADVEARRSYLDVDRALAAFDGRRVVGTLRAFLTPLTLPGGTMLPAAAVTNVAVLPTHRRRGVLRGMLTMALRDAADRGEAVSILIASEYPIYGRFGYGPATEHARWEIDCGLATFANPGAGTVELVDVDTMRAVAPIVYKRAQAAIPGSIARPPEWWDRTLGLAIFDRDEPQPFLAIHRAGDGTASGYVRYRAEGAWDARTPTGMLVVEDLVASSPAAYAALWRYCTEVDLIRTVRADDRPVDEPLPLLLHDARAARQSWRSDFLWARLLDVPSALSARAYDRDGQVVLGLADPSGFAEGCFALDVEAGRGECRRSTAAPDLTLPVGVLSAAYLGGVPLRRLAAAGWVEEHRPGALDVVDGLLRWPQPPWCGTWF